MTTDLARYLSDVPASTKLTTAQIVSVTAGRATITLGGADITGVPYLAHLAPQAGEVVNVLSTGRQYLIIGSPATTSAGYRPLALFAAYSTTPTWAWQASYRIVGDRVFLSGAFQRSDGIGPGTVTVGTIPTEARPPTGRSCNLPVAVNVASGTSPYVARMDFNGAGEMIAYVAQSNVTWLGIDGLSYRRR